VKASGVDVYRGRARDDLFKAQKIVAFFEERGLVKKPASAVDNPSATAALNQQLLSVAEAAQLLGVFVQLDL